MVCEFKDALEVFTEMAREIEGVAGMACEIEISGVETEVWGGSAVRNGGGMTCQK